MYACLLACASSLHCSPLALATIHCSQPARNAIRVQMFNVDDLDDLDAMVADAGKAAAPGGSRRRGTSGPGASFATDGSAGTGGGVSGISEDALGSPGKEHETQSARQDGGGGSAVATAAVLDGAGAGARLLARVSSGTGMLLDSLSRCVSIRPIRVSAITCYHKGCIYIKTDCACSSANRRDEDRSRVATASADGTSERCSAS